MKKDCEMTSTSPAKVFIACIQREPGWLYYFDNGNIMRTRMVRGGQKKKPGDKPEVVLKTDVKREPGFLYYLDKQGDVARTAMASPAPKKPSSQIKKAAKNLVPELEQTDLKTVGGKMGLEVEQKRLKNGNFTSYIKGTKILHCEDGPARIAGKTVEYQIMGLNHRIGGPAYEDNYTKRWEIMGQSHNLDGPALRGEGYEEYYVFGNYLDKKDFEKLTGNKEFMKAARKIEAGISSVMAGLDPAEIKDISKKSKKSESSLFPALALGLMGAGGIALAGHKMKQMSVVKAKAVA